MGANAVDYVAESTGLKSTNLGTYEFGEKMYDFFAEASTAVYAMYAFGSLVCLSLLYMFSQAVSRCIYGQKKGGASGIEAFAYEEDPLAEKKGEADSERVSTVAEESTQEYHNLAGSSRRSAAPAIF